MYDKLGDFIRRTRKQRELTQERLAELADVSRGQLAQLERGENVSMDFLTKVARALGLTEVRIDFLTVRDITPDTPALLMAAEALDHVRQLLARVHEASADLERAAEAIDALLMRPGMPAEAQQHIAAAAARLASAPAERTAEIGRTLRESAESSGRRAPASPDGTAPAARRRAR